MSGKRKPKLGSGERFAKLSGSVEREYEAKGVSPKRAKAIGAAVAADAGRKAHGAKRMAQLSAAGRKRKRG